MKRLIALVVLLVTATVVNAADFAMTVQVPQNLSTPRGELIPPQQMTWWFEWRQPILHTVCSDFLVAWTTQGYVTGEADSVILDPDDDYWVLIYSNKAYWTDSYGTRWTIEMKPYAWKISNGSNWGYGTRGYSVYKE